ncbi:MAG: hypothetical protein NTX50_02155 [Candidatus Sumerlaeota bacterium]|nr:hypothetical protein [Candidatus Sumerlaeota bacterium]
MNRCSQDDDLDAPMEKSLKCYCIACGILFLLLCGLMAADEWGNLAGYSAFASFLWNPPKIVYHMLPEYLQPPRIPAFFFLGLCYFGLVFALLRIFWRNALMLLACLLFFFLLHLAASAFGHAFLNSLRAAI